MATKNLNQVQQKNNATIIASAARASALAGSAAAVLHALMEALGSLEDTPMGDGMTVGIGTALAGQLCCEVGKALEGVTVAGICLHHAMVDAAGYDEIVVDQAAAEAAMKDVVGEAGAKETESEEGRDAGMQAVDLGNEEMEYRADPKYTDVSYS